MGIVWVMICSNDCEQSAFVSFLERSLDIDF
jgi:hypothetical protein